MDLRVKCHAGLVQFLNAQNHRTGGTPTSTTNLIPVSSLAALHDRVAIDPSPTTILPTSSLVEPPSMALEA
jgi:hypothetical protein